MDIEERARKWAEGYANAQKTFTPDFGMDDLTAAYLAGSAQTQQGKSTWILTREYSDSDTCLIQSVHRSQESAAKATEKHDLDPIYGLLTVSEWPVD